MNAVMSIKGDPGGNMDVADAVAIRPLLFASVHRTGPALGFPLVAPHGARIRQIINLLDLAADLQEQLLFLPATVNGRDSITERVVVQL